MSEQDILKKYPKKIVQKMLCYINSDEGILTSALIKKTADYLHKTNKTSKFDSKMLFLILHELKKDGLIEIIHRKSNTIYECNSTVKLTHKGKEIKDHLLLQKYSPTQHEKVLLFLNKNHNIRDIYIEDLIELLWNGSAKNIRTKRTQVTIHINKLEDDGLVIKKHVNYCGVDEPRIRVKLTVEGIALANEIRNTWFDKEVNQIINIFTSLKPIAKKTFIKKLVEHSIHKAQDSN